MPLIIRRASCTAAGIVKAARLADEAMLLAILIAIDIGIGAEFYYRMESQ